MEGPRYLDDTSLQTLTYLESRLLRLEHVLYGHTTPPAKAPALPNLQQLEHRFAQLLERVRTYTELLKICTSSRPSSNPCMKQTARTYTHITKHTCAKAR